MNRSLRKLSTFKAWSLWNWMDDDSKEDFDLHWGNPHARQQLEANGFTYKTVIEYQIDQYGLRNSSNINISDSILTLGCSFTFGTGLDTKDIWPTVLGSTLNKPVYNAGIPGSSNDTAFRLADYLIPKYKPLAVVLLSPFDVRYEFYDRWLPFDYTAASYPIWVGEAPDNGIELATEMHNTLNAKKNILAIRCLCNDYNIPFIWENINDARAGVDKNDLARDLKHFGKKSHKLIADRFSNRLTLKQ